MTPVEQALEEALSRTGGALLRRDRPTERIIMVHFQSHHHMRYFHQVFGANFLSLISESGNSLLYRCANPTDARAIRDHIDRVLTQMDTNLLRTEFDPDWLPNYLQGSRLGVERIEIYDQPASDETAWANASHQCLSLKVKNDRAQDLYRSDMLLVSLQEVIAQWFECLAAGMSPEDDREELKDLLMDIASIFVMVERNHNLILSDVFYHAAKAIPTKILLHGGVSDPMVPGSELSHLKYWLREHDVTTNRMIPSRSNIRALEKLIDWMDRRFNHLMRNTRQLPSQYLDALADPDIIQLDFTGARERTPAGALIKSFGFHLALSRIVSRTRKSEEYIYDYARKLQRGQDIKGFSSRFMEIQPGQGTADHYSGD